MFFLYDIFQNGNALNPTGNNTSVDTLKISNGIFDHINLLDIISLNNNEFDTTKPSDYNINTLIDIPFSNSINAGEISQFIGFIDHLDIRRKEYDSDDWITLQSIYKNVNTGEIKTNFTMNDTYGKNNTIYSYQVVPVGENGEDGTALQVDVLSRFNGAYIVDSSNVYNIMPEYTLSNNQRNQSSILYVPYGSKYPFVSFNAKTNYDSGNVTAVLISPTSNQLNSSYIDRFAQVKLINDFNSWLTNAKAKIIKDFNGLFKIVAVIDSISNGYYKELGNGLASSSFSYVEVGEFSQDYLEALGMVYNFPLKFKD